MAEQVLIVDDPEFIQEDLRWVRVEAVQGFGVVTVRFDHMLDGTTLLAFRDYHRLPHFGPNGRPQLSKYLDDYEPNGDDPESEFYQQMADLVIQIMGNTHVNLHVWEDYLEGGLYF